MRAKPEKTMGTLIIEYLQEKTQKGKDEETDLKKKSKLFLKEVLEAKRDYYSSQASSVASAKVKKTFQYSRNSLVKQKLEPVTC